MKLSQVVKIRSLVTACAHQTDPLDRSAGFHGADLQKFARSVLGTVHAFVIIACMSPNRSDVCDLYTSPRDAL